MERRVVFDIEGNGLLDTVDTVWCICTQDIDTLEKRKFRPDEIEDGIKYLESCDLLIGHNIIGYDFPVLAWLYDFHFHGRIIDTLVWSRTLNPDRKLPRGCPTHYAGADGKKKIVGSHTIQAWGFKVGQFKVDHTDWTQFSEHMLFRCSEDVEINYKVFRLMLEEAGMTLEDV